jgi:hypothetical protein
MRTGYPIIAENLRKPEISFQSREKRVSLMYLVGNFRVAGMDQHPVPARHEETILIRIFFHEDRVDSPA